MELLGKTPDAAYQWTNGKSCSINNRADLVAEVGRTRKLVPLTVTAASTLSK